jgi:threonine dehydratase
LLTETQKRGFYACATTSEMKDHVLANVQRGARLISDEAGALQYLGIKASQKEKAAGRMTSSDGDVDQTNLVSLRDRRTRKQKRNHGC